LPSGDVLAFADEWADVPVLEGTVARRHQIPRSRQAFRRLGDGGAAGSGDVDALVERAAVRVQQRVRVGGPWNCTRVAEVRANGLAVEGLTG
jgi:hypothetical protein